MSARKPPHAAEPVERMQPDDAAVALLAEHLGRYEFAAQFVSGKRLLDAACGNGYGSQILTRMGSASYIGVDIDDGAVRNATRSYGHTPRVRFQTDDVERLSTIEDASVDVLVSFETIEHLDNPSQFLRTINRVLAPGGLLLVSTPNRAISNPWGTLESRPPNPFHIREWRPREFRQLLERFFRVERDLGQGLELPLKTVGRALAEHPSLAWMKSAYRATKRPAPPSSNVRPLPVVARRPGRVPTFMVCVCRKDGT